MSLLPILELITAGAKIFSKERSLYYINRSEKLRSIIEQQSDANFYNKDMDAKAKAERKLQRDTEKLRLEYLADLKDFKK